MVVDGRRRAALRRWVATWEIHFSVNWFFTTVRTGFTPIGRATLDAFRKNSLFILDYDYDRYSRRELLDLNDVVTGSGRNGGPRLPLQNAPMTVGFAQ